MLKSKRISLSLGKSTIRANHLSLLLHFPLLALLDQGHNWSSHYMDYISFHPQ